MVLKNRSRNSDQVHQDDCSTAGSVVLTRLGNHLLVSETARSRLARMRIGRLVVSDSGETVRQLAPVFGTTSLALGGLTHCLADTLCQIGWRVQIKWNSSRPSALPEPVFDTPFLSGSGTCLDRQAVNFLRDYETGLIRLWPGCDVAWYLAQAIFAYPTARITIVVTSEAQRDDLARRLNHFGIAVSVLNSLPLADSFEPERVLIGTPAALADGMLEVEKCNIVFVADAHAVCHQWVQTMLSDPSASYRLFGLVSGDDRASQWTRDMMTCAFGVAEFTVPSHGHVLADIRRCHPMIRHPTLQLTNARDAYTHGIIGNPRRNQELARIARALSQFRTLTATAELDLTEYFGPRDHLVLQRTIRVLRLRL